MADRVVRVGVLGAARIAPVALIRPAARNGRSVVAAVAARDPARAARFARRHRIPVVHPNYDALVEDPNVDAIYIPLPNGLHAKWTLAALAAGKHVLCEKPLTANAEEAVAVAAAAERAGLVVMEAFHYRYHPLAARVREIVASGELGPLRHVSAHICFPLPRFSDIRYQYNLAGGALMDAGCYAVHMARTFGLEEPEVTGARARLRSDTVDRAMTAELRYPSGHTGTVRCSMWSRRLLDLSVTVTGERGRLRVVNPVMPQLYHRLSVHIGGRGRVERFGRRPTYGYQLEAFCAAVLDGAPTLTPPSDSVANMRIIDAIYVAAGLPLRGT